MASFFLLLLVIVFPLHPTLRAERSLLLQAQGVSSLEFKAFLRTEGPYESFESFYIRERPFMKEKSKELLHSLKEAQSFYLSGDLEKARKAFQSLSRLSLQGDWSTEEKKTLHYAFLRLIQLSKGLSEKENLFLEALHFAPQIKANPYLFPPFLIKEFESFQSSMDVHLWIPGRKFRPFSSLHINSQVHRRPFIQGIKIPENRAFRLTMLSNIFLPVSKVFASYQELALWSPPQTPFVTGSCHHHSFPASSWLKQAFFQNPTMTVFLFFHPHCIKALKLEDLFDPPSQKPSPFKKEMDKKKSSPTASWKKRKMVDKNPAQQKASLNKDFLTLSRTSKVLTPVVHHPTLYAPLSQKRFSNKKRESQPPPSLSLQYQEAEKLPKTPPPFKWKSMMKNKWLWVGVGSLITTSFFLMMQKKEEPPPPPTRKRRRGF